MLSIIETTGELGQRVEQGFRDIHTISIAAVRAALEIRLGELLAEALIARVEDLPEIAQDIAACRSMIGRLHASAL
jgi:hypothetical protein